MKLQLFFAIALAFASSLGANELTAADRRSPGLEDEDLSGEITDSQPKLIHISATIDGSGKFVFTRQGARYEHKHWAQPTNISFDGEPWLNLSHTPPAWLDVASKLDLTKAWIVKRKGRDMIAIEQTPDGFDLYLCDSPNGSAPYEVTIAIPRRH